MSLLSTISKKVAPKVTSLAKGLASKAAPIASKGASKVVDTMGLRGMSDQFGASVAKAIAPQGTSKFVQSPKASDVYKSAAMGASNFVPVGKVFQGAKAGFNAAKSTFPSAATNFAEKMAGVTTKYADDIKKGGTQIPTRNPSPIKSGSVDQRTFSDIRPNTKPTVTAKTNTARNSTLDTRATPTKVGTTNKFPYAKTAIGLGAAGLGINALMPGEQSAAPLAEPSYDGANFATPVGAEQAPQDPGTSVLSPDVVFGGGNNEGGVFESPTPAPQTGTQMGGSFQPGFASFGLSGGNAGGAGTGSSIGGSGGSQFKLKTDEYIDETDKIGKNGRYRKFRNDAQDESVRNKKQLDRAAEKESLRIANLDKQASDYQKRIDALMNRQASYGIDLEGTAASSTAREGLADMFDRETRKSLIPLQTSLALVQAERERADKLRQQEFENNLDLNPVSSENNAFTLGAGQTRFALDPTTGQYKVVGSVDPKADSPDDLPTSIQEYQYARSQGYQGTFNDFKQQSSSDTQPGTKILTPTEAAALGVPYGTTQAQAYGQNPSKMSGEAAKVSAIASTMIPEINALKQRFTQNYKGALTGLLTGTDRELVKLVDQIADKVGRLRSGGAVNADEEARFKRQIASFMDLPFGNGQQAIQALDGLINEAQQVSSSIDPYYQGSNMQPVGQQSTGGSWNW